MSGRALVAGWLVVATAACGGVDVDAEGARTPRRQTMLDLGAAVKSILADSNA